MVPGIAGIGTARVIPAALVRAFTIAGVFLRALIPKSIALVRALGRALVCLTRIAESLASAGSVHVIVKSQE